MSRRLKKGKDFFFKTEAIKNLDGEIEQYLRKSRYFLEKNDSKNSDKNHQKTTISRIRSL